MISVEDALSTINSNLASFGNEQIPFAQSVGRILAEDIFADRDSPPYDRAAMDGIAISHADWESGLRAFPVAGEQFAGDPQQTLKSGTCLEIMTGAIVPVDANVVIRYEDVTIADGIATVNLDEVEEGRHIHEQGTDASSGDVLIPKGKKLTYGDVGILTSVGKVEVSVIRQPKVALISTGDELIEPDQVPLPHQVRKSNIHTLGVLLAKEGIQFQAFHINDEWEEVLKELAGVLNNYDVVLMSGGVSKGKKDYIPEALEELGVEKHFHRILQRPGKPLWFGSNDQTTVFGFPGNPVSTLVCYVVYFRRWLNESLGSPVSDTHAVLTEHVSFGKDLTYFMSVSTKNDNGLLKATPVKGNGSGDLVSLSHADGFLELPAESSEFQEGEVYRVHLL